MSVWHLKGCLADSKASVCVHGLFSNKGAENTDHVFSHIVFPSNILPLGA